MTIPERERLPDTRESLTIRFTMAKAIDRIAVVNGQPSIVRDDLRGYLTIGFYSDGRPGELFLKIGKEGDDMRVYDALMIAISIGLQYGIPLDVFINKMENMRFTPSGVTDNGQVPLAKSIPDFIARLLRAKFLNG